MPGSDGSPSNTSPFSPPPPHPDSKISPAPAISSHNDKHEREPSPDTRAKIAWKDKLNDVDDRRRPSIQFSVEQAEAILRGESPGPKGRKSKSISIRRLSSPPPPPAHQSRVSFDTFANPDVTATSFAFTSAHKEYDYSSTGRTFLVGTDENDYSGYALEWLLEEMVDDNDTVICLRVVDKEAKSTTVVDKKKYKSEAQVLFKKLQETSGNRKITLILEFASGKVQDNIMRMIELYAPNFLVVGTRGRNLSGFQGLLPNSVSKWCVQNSPIPVVVARKSEKRKKSKAVRQADPSRRSYQALLKNNPNSTSNVLASHGHGPLAVGDNPSLIPNLDGQPITAENLHLLADGQTEADAVARAIGIPTEYSASTILARRSSRASATSGTGTSIADSSEAGEAYSLGRSVSATSEGYDLESPSPTGPLRDESQGYFTGDGQSKKGDLDVDDNSGGSDSIASTSAATNIPIPEVRLERKATDLALMDQAAGKGS